MAAAARQRHAICPASCCRTRSPSPPSSRPPRAPNCSSSRRRSRRCPPWRGELAAAGARAPLVWLSKGFVAVPATRRIRRASRSRTRSWRRCWPAPVGVVSGPSFAEEVARGLPTAVAVAATDAARSPRTWRRCCARDTLRAYESDDIAGVEVGGAVKNVLAIAAGASDGLGFGHNARAALITRGLAETGRLSAALGGRRETLMGLAGLGDLVLTCTGDLSRNRRVGLALAAGQIAAGDPRRAGARRRGRRRRGRGARARRATTASRCRSATRSTACSTKAWRRATPSSACCSASRAPSGISDPRTRCQSRAPGEHRITRAAETGLPPRLVDGDRHGVGQIEAAHARAASGS